MLYRLVESTSASTESGGVSPECVTGGSYTVRIGTTPVHSVDGELGPPRRPFTIYCPSTIGSHSATVAASSLDVMSRTAATRPGISLSDNTSRTAFASSAGSSAPRTTADR